MRTATVLTFITALGGASLFAQHPKSMQSSGTLFPAEGIDAPPAAAQVIFSNLGKGTTDIYSDGGWLITGPTSTAQETEYIAMPFTPQANAHVEQVRAAIQYLSSGANQVDLSVYSDANGAPGSLLAGPITVKNLPVDFTCCKLAIANISPALSVTAGTRYWLVAETPVSGTGSDFEGVWVFVPPTKQLVGANQGSNWFAFDAALEEPAGAIFGTVP